MDDSNPKRQKYSLKRKLDDLYGRLAPGPSNPKKLMSAEAAKFLRIKAEIRAGHYDADPGYHTYYNNFSVYPRHWRKTKRPRWLPYVLKGRSRSELIRSRRMKNKLIPHRRKSGYKWQSRHAPQPRKFGRSFQYSLE